MRQDAVCGHALWPARPFVDQWGPRPAQTACGVSQAQVVMAATVIGSLGTWHVPCRPWRLAAERCAYLV